MLILAALLLAGDSPVDAERAAWKYKRKVAVAGHAALASLTLPPELSTKAGPSGRDFRLVDETGRETPYLLDWTSEREGLATWRASVKDVRREKEEAGEASSIRSQWTIDLGEARTFTDLMVHVPDVAFAWHVRVESSVDGGQYHLIQGDAALFDQTWNNERVRKTDIRFDAPLTARYLRLTARSAAHSPTLELEGASVTLRRRLKGDQWSMSVAAAPVDGAESERKNTTRYRLDASSLLPFNEVEVASDDPSFARRARLIEERESLGKRTTSVLGEGEIFRLRANDVAIQGDAARFVTRNGSGGPLFLEIDNAGSPPLRGLKVRVHGSRVRLLFPVSGRTLTLYYGNETTRVPGYDLEGLRPRLTQALDTTPATLGIEELNPLFKREPPLRFAATVGASLEPSRWRHQRVLTPIREEDVYAMTLRAGDLGVLRPDLADLRVVDGENQQVPFLIDQDFAEERVVLRVQEQASQPAHRSSYKLTPMGAWAGNHPPRISRIEIEVADAFFERPARLLHSKNQTHREAPFSFMLARRPPSAGPLIIGTTASLETLTLELDDGDNQALDIRSAVAIVRVPRIVFKAAPGNLRLLLESPGAEAPRYDLVGLRGELLAYSAVPTSAGPLSENKGARTRFWSGWEMAPRGAVVWGAIIMAIIALIALTLRTLKGA